jgi:hypothetical protein
MKQKDVFNANTSNFERARITKVQLRKVKSPDTSKMLSISVPDIRAIFYFNKKTNMKRKIKQLETAGLKYIFK